MSDSSSAHTVQFHFSPHQGTPDFPGGQVKLIALCMLFRTVIAAVGRRFGKTQAAMMAILEHYRSGKYAGRPFIAAYCGPTYKAALRQYDEALDFFGPLVTQRNRTEGWLRLMPVNGNLGGLIHFWSLENYDNLRGARLDFCVIDEAKDVKEDAYVNVIRPMLVDTRGHILIIGTPHPAGVGFQWFRREFYRGQDESFPSYASMTAPSEGNPYMPRDVLAEERRNCPSLLVERSEYDAAFVDDLGAVFERIDEAFSLPYTSVGRDIARGAGPVDGRSYLIGYDVGRHDDPAIITVFDEAARNQVYLWRGTQVPFETQLEALSEIRGSYNDAVVYADNNGMGEAVFERLGMAFGEGVVGRKWNRFNKEVDVGRAMSLFQRAHWRFLAVPWQKQQFYAYIRTKLPAGGYRYEAAPGEKDDAVAAACFLAHRLVVPMELEVEPPKRHNMFAPDGGIDLEYWDREERRARLQRLARSWR